ncbi:MAG: PASTA domain-containing protein [Marmoricola sp.]
MSIEQTDSANISKLQNVADETASAEAVARVTHQVLTSAGLDNVEPPRSRRQPGWLVPGLVAAAVVTSVVGGGVFADQIGNKSPSGTHGSAQAGQPNRDAAPLGELPEKSAWATVPNSLPGDWQIAAVPGETAERPDVVAAGSISFTTDGRITLRILGCGAASGNYAFTQDQELYVTFPSPDAFPTCTSTINDPELAGTPPSFMDIAEFLSIGQPFDVSDANRDTPTIGALDGTHLSLGRGLADSAPLTNGAMGNEKVPDLAGLTLDQATALLREKGVAFQVRSARVFNIDGSKQKPANRIVATMPAAGDTIPTGDALQIWYPVVASNW